MVFAAKVNFVFISPHFPPNWAQFAIALREAGANVLGITDTTFEQLSPQLRGALNDHYRVDNLGDYDQQVRALGYFISRHGRIDRLDSLNEHWLQLEAALRTDFNIFGINGRQIEHIKRKSLMKRRFINAGLSVARGRVYRHTKAVRAFAAEVGFPIVAKPDIGVGAAATYKIADAAELESFLSALPAVPYIFEEFISGQIVTYDGMTDRRGRVVHESSMTYGDGVMEIVNSGGDIFYYLTREIAPDLRELGQQVVRAFDVRERPFHFEFFRTSEGVLMPLEVNMRPPGGLSIDMFNYAHDLDFAREWASLVVHDRVESPSVRPFNCLYVGRRYHRRYQLSDDEARSAFASLIVHHESISDVFSGALGDHGYLLRSPQLEPLLAAAQAMIAIAD